MRDYVSTTLGNQIVARLRIAARQSPFVVHHALVGVVDASIKIARIENVDLTTTSTFQCFLNRIFPLVVTVAFNGIHQAVLLVGWRGRIRIRLPSAGSLGTHAINIARPLWTIAQPTNLVEAGTGKETVKVKSIEHYT